MSVNALDALEAELLAFLTERTGMHLGPEDDLFATGTVSSLFAMQLVVHVEQAYGVVVGGDDLKLDHFRSARAMAALVARLRGTP